MTGFARSEWSAKPRTIVGRKATDPDRSVRSGHDKKTPFRPFANYGAALTAVETDRTAAQMVIASLPGDPVLSTAAFLPKSSGREAGESC